MPSRRSLTAALVAATTLAAVPATPAVAANKSSAARRAAARHELLREVRRNPGVVRRRAFLKRAALVNFKLPVTIRLRTGNDPATTNTNRATIDLGASLGRREVELAGTLAGEITFRDSFDGGALGNVDIDLLPSPDTSAFGLSTTSVPLLWNDQVNAGSWAPGAPTPGCGDFTGSGAVGVVPGVDGLDRLAASKAPGNDALGGNAQPFPSSASAPGGFTQPPDVRNTVLRTGSLRLQIAPAGIEIDWAHPPDGHGQASQNYVTQKSGGQANLFGNIPGKAYGIDVMVTLATKINSLLRIVDNDPTASVAGSPWPAASLSCRQVWTGWVQNYLLGITLGGSLKIAPGITPDGRLRIAKASLSGVSPYRTPLAACLQPYSAYAAQANNSDTAAVTAPTAPIDPTTARPAPDVPCNATPTRHLRDMGLAPLGPASVANGYTVDWTGAQVTVGGDITVDNISADVLIGG
jgi:hypothetical protein